MTVLDTSFQSVWFCQYCGSIWYAFAVGLVGVSPGWRSIVPEAPGSQTYSPMPRLVCSKGLFGISSWLANIVTLAYAIRLLELAVAKAAPVRALAPLEEGGFLRRGVVDFL